MQLENGDLAATAAALEAIIRDEFTREGVLTMLDDLKEEEIVNKVGGRFKLSTLIQKRMVALNTGAKPLVDLKPATSWPSSSRRSCRTRSTWTRPATCTRRT